MAVVWDSVLDNEIPALRTFGGYENPARVSPSITHSHFYWPGSVSHLPNPFNHKSDLSPWKPASDIRETKLAYHIEIEVPGVSDKKAIQITWLSPHTLQVDGAATRPDLERGREGDGESIWESDPANGVSKSDGENDGGPCVRCVDRENEMTTSMIAEERKIGAWRRVFTLPFGCDMKKAKARLDAGLLRISVFKKEVVEGGEPVNLIEVE